MTDDHTSPSPERYTVERAICAKAQAYAESVMCEGGIIRAAILYYLEE